MPEIRFDIVSGHFVIVAAERGKRPSDWRVAQKTEAEPREFDPECPLCPGNERLTPPELYALRTGTEADAPGWRVRVVPNKFPALVNPKDIPGDLEWRVPSVPDQVPEDLDTAMYWMGPGVGAHEVVIESTRHAGTLGSYAPEHVKEVLQVIKDRTLLLYDRKEIKYVQVFKNHGHGGGASLSHPHFQIIGLPVLPSLVVNEGLRQRDYEARTGRCLICDLIERELEKDVRVVSKGREYVVLSPFASRYAYETIIAPRKHTASFLEFSAEETSALAGAIVELFARYESLFAALPYNMVFHGMPEVTRRKRKWPYHAHIHVYPRLNAEAGLELGTGVYINPVPPELATKQLRSAERG